MLAGLKILPGGAAAVACAAALGACGSSTIKVARDSPYRQGAVLFNQHCAGCHSLAPAGAQGSATKVRDRERTDGPNFNVRKEKVDQVLYAIRNGGFSGAIMPENMVVGREAQAVAQFLARYAGAKSGASASTSQGSSGSGGNP